MDAGLIWSVDELRFELAGSASNSGDPNNGYVAQARLVTAQDVLGTVSNGIDIRISCEENSVATGPGAAATYYRLDWAGVVAGGLWTDSGFAASPSASLILQGVRVYVVHSVLFLWRVEWDSWMFVAGGLVRTSGSSGSAQSAPLNPAGIPFLGIPATVSAACDLAAVPSDDGTADGVSTFAYRADMTASGGWRYRIGSDWFSPSVSLSAVALPANPLGWPNPSMPAIAGTTTSNLSAQAWYEWSQPTTTTRTLLVASSYVMGLPDLPKSVERLGDDYRAMIYRGGFPECSATAAIVADPFTGGTSDTDTVTWAPSRSELLSTVDATTHAIEDPFADATLAPYGQTSTDIRSNTVAYVTWSVGSSSGPSVETRVANPDILAYLDCDEAVGRYVNTVASPHWSFSYWFPPDVLDDETPLQSWEWPLFGQRAIPSLYWLKIRSQWLYHPSLPAGERPETRTDLVSAPLLETGLSGHFSDAFGQVTSPWGVCRFHAEDALAGRPAAIELDERTEGDWTFEDCAGTFGGSSIAATADPSASSCTIEYEFGKWGRWPRCADFPWDEVLLGWSGVSSMAVKLVGEDGSAATLASAAGTHGWPGTLPAVKYAGTWGQEWNPAVWLGSDEGTDSEPNGVSAASMLDPVRVHWLRLLPTRTAKKLRFEVSLASPGASFSIDYPELTMRSDVPTLVRESGQTASILYADGPGYRWGQLTWWNYAFDFFQDSPPIVLPPYSQCTALDYLCWRRTAVEGLAADDGLDAELASLFDAREGQTRIKAAYDTVSWLVEANSKLVGVVDNTMREVPPVATLPRRARDADLQETGSLALEAWSCANETRHLIAPQDHDQYDLSPAAITSASSLVSVSGWFVRDHKLAVDNEEGPTYPIRSGGDEYALASPWHGYFATYSPPGSAGTLFVDVSRVQKHVWGYIEAGSWWTEEALGNRTPIAFDRVQQKLTGERARMAFARTGRPDRRYLVLEESGDCSLLFSDDDGGRWTVAVSLGAGEHPTVCVAPDGTIYCYWIDAGDIKGQVFDPRFNVLAGPFTAVAGVDDTGIDCAASRGPDGAQRICLVYAVAGTATIDFSTTGFQP